MLVTTGNRINQPTYARKQRGQQGKETPLSKCQERQRYCTPYRTERELLPLMHPCVACHQLQFVALDISPDRHIKETGTTVLREHIDDVTTRCVVRVGPLR